MGEIARWQTLTCPCGSKRFYSVFEMRRHGSGGLSHDPVGQRCATCHNDADVQAMLRELQLAQMRRDLAAREAELDSLAPPVRPAPSNAASSPA